MHKHFSLNKWIKPLNSNLLILYWDHVEIASLKKIANPNTSVVIQARPGTMVPGHNQAHQNAYHVAHARQDKEVTGVSLISCMH